MEKPVTAVNYQDDIIQVRLQKVTKHPVFIAKLFEVISEEGINVDMISQVMLEDDAQIEFTCMDKDQHALNNAIEKLKQEHDMLEIYENRMVSKVTVIGKAMETEVGVAAKVFSLFGKYDIHFYQVTTSKISISYLIDKDKRGLAVEKIKEMYNIQGE